MTILYDSFSVCGPRRKDEDYIAIREMPAPKRNVFVLCDGMGGHCLGDVASHLVAEHICGYWERNPDMDDSTAKVANACTEAMTAFNEKSRVEMGTTMTMVSIEGHKATLAHCGDSRIYMVRDRCIIYQSADHVALNPEGWPVITRAFFTGHTDYLPDIKEIDVRPGDMILLCSDGVHGNGKWRDLHDVLTAPADVRPSSRLIHTIEAIASRHAHDNYSAILIRIYADET